MPISDAEADRLTSFLEPTEEELEAIAIGDITESEEVDEIEVLPELAPIDDGDPARNHPNRIESPVQALSEDEIDRMRARLDRALGSSNGSTGPAAESEAQPSSAETPASEEQLTLSEAPAMEEELPLVADSAMEEELPLASDSAIEEELPLAADSAIEEELPKAAVVASEVQPAALVEAEPLDAVLIED